MVGTQGFLDFGLLVSSGQLMKLLSQESLSPDSRPFCNTKICQILHFYNTTLSLATTDLGVVAYGCSFSQHRTLMTSRIFILIQINIIIDKMIWCTNFASK
jgi:hypothetical protein